jgi:lipopolysaccharide export system permease protein
MNTYTKFLIIIFSKSFLYISAITLSLLLVINLLTELDFFKEINVSIKTPLLLTFLISPSILFEMFPFIFLITGQLFFVKLLENNEIETLKYSGLKNTNILKILTLISLVTGMVISIFFYTFSSNFKNLYLELKSKYTTDGKYLAVITKNGLWIKDIINKKKIIINSYKIENEYLINNFINEFDENYQLIRTIKSEKINIKNKNWMIYNADIFIKNQKKNEKLLQLKTNFDYNIINSLYSDLSSLSLFELLELRENYKNLNYSINDINLQLLKLAINPLYMVLMTIFAGITMLRIKKIKSTTYKISIGLFFSVIIYYIKNFFYVMGSTGKLSLISSIFIPMIMLSFITILMLIKINDK